MTTTLTKIAMALALTVTSIGGASAMMQKDDLYQNTLPDEGVSTQILSDIDQGAWHLRERLESGLSDMSHELAPPKRIQLDILGKHLI